MREGFGLSVYWKSAIRQILAVDWTKMRGDIVIIDSVSAPQEMVIICEPGLCKL